MFRAKVERSVNLTARVRFQLLFLLRVTLDWEVASFSQFVNLYNGYDYIHFFLDML